MSQDHPARNLHERLTVVFTAHSAYTSFMKHHICKFVLMRKCVPINPFMSFDYFLLDSVPRDVVRQGNNTYIHIADEVWVFGIIADGVLEEIRLAKALGKEVRYFSLGKSMESIREITINHLEYEKGVIRVEQLEI